jgi:hypothetical protein
MENITTMENITSMSSTNDLDKALDYYKVKGKRYETIARALGIIPKKIVKGKETKQLLKVGTQKYKEVIKERVVEKWKDDTREYGANYRMSFRRYDSNSKQMITMYINIGATGTKDTILADALREYELKVKRYQEQYPENDSYAFDEIPTTGLIPMTSGSGVVVENQRVETSVSGGQRVVGKRGVKRNMKMKDAFAFFKFGDETQEWNTNRGKCVFDYLIWRYKDTKGFIKELRNGEDFLNDLFRNINIEEQNPIIQGVSVNQLEKFCDYFGVNMYAFDKGDNLIEKYESKKKGRGEALIFVVYDNHFYPVTNTSERKSKSCRTSNSAHITSNSIEAYEGEKDGKIRDIISPTEEEFEDMKKDKPDYLAVQNKWVLDYFKKNDGNLPFPIDANNIYIEDATIERIVYDDKIIITKPINQYVKRFYEDMGLPYQGECVLSVLNFLWKAKYGFKFDTSPFLSQVNIDVREALDAEKVKWRTHLGRIQSYIEPETIKEMLINGNAVAVDITRCYCDAIYNQKEKFIVFKGKEIVEEYDGKPLTLGLYFVETDDMNLFHQSNWYSKVIIELAIQEDINFTITRQIRCVDEDWNYEKVTTDEDDNIISTISLDNSNLFKDFCDDVIELTEQDEDFTLTKLIINMLTGLLGKTHFNKKEIGLSKNLQEVWDDWLVPDIQDNPDVNVYLNTIESGDDKVYLYGTNERVKIKLSNGVPMYIQLLDWSNIALYNLCKDVGGEVVYRKTDCIVSIGGVIPEDKMAKDICCYTERFGKYHQEDIEKALLFNYELLMNTNRKVRTPILDNDWNTYTEFKSSNDWEAIIKTAKEKGGMLITGRAGTGKSYVISKGVEEKLLPDCDETRLAFTNRAAKNIRGTTIHKVMAIDKNMKSNTKTLESLKKYDTFIVDEVSMINAVLWDKLMILKATTKATFILLGDYRQCRPIESGKEIDYFNHPYCKRLVNCNRCELTEPQRYDMKLWKWLEDFYEYGINDFNVIPFKNISLNDVLYKKNICFTNKKRCYINQLCMEHFIKQKEYVTLKKPEKGSNEYADDAYIYIGLPVMSVVGNADMGTYNTEELYVTNFSVDNETIELCRLEGDYEGECIELSFSLFHKDFVVNYASTTHKSQGITIDSDINIFEWSLMKDMGGKNICYTAVSRAKKCEQITLVLTISETIYYTPQPVIKKQEKKEIEIKKKQSHKCNCNINVLHICSCNNPKYILSKPNNELYCDNCNKWKCRCIE